MPRAPRSFLPLVPPRRAVARVVAVAAGCVALAVAAGCGGGDDDDTGSVGSATTTATAPARGSAVATDLDRRLVSVVQELSPRVVQIETSSGLGSGIVFDNRGDIVTNAHVVGNSTKFTVTLAGGSRHTARLVGTFPPDDLAVVRLDPLPSPAPTAATFADSSKLEVGQLVLAIGNPLGLRSSVTDGIVSSLARTVPEGNGAVIASAIQTSASINPGNSGGALGNLDGDVIGIPTLAATDPELGDSQAIGIGFAIPSNTVRRIAAQLIDTGHVTASGRAFLGINVATAATGSGVIIASVQQNGP
ncbi:MAG TPA: trypsin-like peptidase domain-containing protein, partial [Baekduia sp.]|nr:trypsin-like peptidase domain-containing protein [Baekduia sp.]